jgi:hypothetical protein
MHFIGQVLGGCGNQPWENRREGSGRWTANITGTWRASSGTLRANVAFRVRDRRYWSLLHGTRGEPATSIGEARPRVTPPRTPVNCRRAYCRLSTMSETSQLIPKLYREAAEQVRQLAARSRLADVRDDLLELSARFERLSAYAEAAVSRGLTGYPHGELLPLADDRPHHGDPARQGQGRTKRQRSSTSPASASSRLRRARQKSRTSDPLALPRLDGSPPST